MHVISLFLRQEGRRRNLQDDTQWYSGHIDKVSTEKPAHSQLLGIAVWIRGHVCTLMSTGTARVSKTWVSSNRKSVA